MKRIFFVLLAGSMLYTFSYADDSLKIYNRREQALKKWRDNKFGMFIHWGLYSIPAGVWKGKESKHPNAEHIQLSNKIPNKEYAKLAEKFDPEKFDPEKWVKLAKEAGMKYMIITAKHQDGFAMYHSDVSSFNVVDTTPFAKDPLKMLAAAARKNDLDFGFYYSQARDHRHPYANFNRYGNTWDFPKASREQYIRYLNEKAKPQIKELLTNYGDISVMWFDVPYKIPPEQSKNIYQLVKSIQPDCLINSRLGGPLWDYKSLGDNEIADSPNDSPWETCMTTNDTWGYRKSDNNWKTSKQVIRYLVDIAGKGGNLLLNVGPKADGTIPIPAVKILEGVGKWMDKNSESIFGTKATVIDQPRWGRCTAKDDKIFLHVFDWPENGKLKISNITFEPKRAYFLENKRNIGFSKIDNSIYFALPDKPLNDIDTVIVLAK